ncbi:MAG: FG-GAP repeat domain-containing protein, partial [Methylococcales bacterium]
LARFPGDGRSDLLVGRMADAIYRRGETVSAMVQQYQYQWQRLDSLSNQWQARYQFGFWILPLDIPLIADRDLDGFDEQMLYRPKTGQWFLFPNQLIDGPSLPVATSPLPVVGRFLPGSSGDLAVWSPINGQFVTKSLSGNDTATMEWGGLEGDILLPGDYDGDGYDEVGIWQPHSNTWWVRNMPSGPNLQSHFGTASGIPLPADYDGDGRLDLAYWEPKQHKILVSFDFGQTVGRTIPVPPDSIPAFVHMY